MNKRGQVYILAAIIISIIVYGMVSITNSATQEDVASDFERISRNYATETAKLVNSVGAGGSMLESFRNFTVIFASYAKAQSPRFELISMLDDSENKKLYIGNFLKQHIIVRCEPASACQDIAPVEGCYSNVPVTIGFDGLQVPVTIYQQSIGDCSTEIDYGATPIRNITFSIGDVAYKFALRRGQPEVVVVGWESLTKQRKVFTKGNFIAATAEVMNLTSYCADRRLDTGCSTLPAGGYCNNDCSPKCGLIKSTEECELNNAYCKWSGYRRMCIGITEES